MFAVDIVIDLLAICDQFQLFCTIFIGKINDNERKKLIDTNAPHHRHNEQHLAESTTALKWSNCLLLVVQSTEKLR